MNEAPLFRFLFFLIAGILFAIYLPLLNQNFSFVINFLLLVAMLFQLYTRRKKYAFKTRWVIGIVACLFSFFTGYTLTLLNTESKYPHHFRNIPGASAYMGYVEQPLNEKEKSFKTILKIKNVLVKEEWVSTTGNCLVYISKDSLAAGLKYGDLILFQQKPLEVKAPTNPSQFNYKKWLAYDKVYDYTFIYPDQWKLLGHHQGFWIRDFAFSLREKLLDVFRQNGINGQDYAVLSALTLGDENDIEPDTFRAFAASGTLHILSVSGMHVGIIFIAMNFLLGFLDKRRATRIIKTILIIFFLWFYALLTGLSSPVIRSAAMLSFIVFGLSEGKSTTLFNVLVASAFFLLCCNPYWITQVGFQLSYLAVAGIIFIHPLIYNWFDVPNWFLRQVWSIIAVSIAAQLATFPLGLFYFHQFPTYFLLSNLVIIPLSSFIIYGGIVLLIFAKWIALFKLPGIIVGNAVHLLNSIVFGIEGLPHSLVKGISISILEIFLIYVLISLIMFWLVKKHINYFLASLGVLSVLLGLLITKRMKQSSQQYVVVYNIPKKSVINFIDGRQHILMADSSVVTNKNLMNFNIYNYWCERGLSDDNVTLASPFSNKILFMNIRCIKINKLSSDLSRTADLLEADFVILSDNVKGSLKDLLHHMRFKKLIIDSSNSIYRATAWIEEAKNLGIPCYSVLHSGAFVFNINER